MTIKLSDHFTFRKLLRFTLPSIAMMIFTSIYGVVDGFFVSNFVGKTPFAALNFIMPFLMILGTFGFMFGTGGSALVSKTLGEGDAPRANRVFTFLVAVTLGLGILVAALGIAFLRPIAALLGAEGELLEDSVVYGRVILLALPFFMLQLEFQSFFVTAEKPKVGLYVTVASGVVNMVLDALFVGVFRFGLAGAAAATALSQTTGGVIPLFYFAKKRNGSLLSFVRFGFDGKALFRATTNGFSELMSNVSMNLVGMLYNIQLLKFAGENGVAAYGVLMYVNFIFVSFFVGYSIGVAPVVGFHFGAGNHDELHSVLLRSFAVLGASAVAMLALSLIFADPLAGLFVGYDEELFEMTAHGIRVFSFSFLFAGFAIFGSSFFTALNNGGVSAAIAFLRTGLFQGAAILILPIFFGLDGVWYSVPVAEFLAVTVFAVFLAAEKKRYRY